MKRRGGTPGEEIVPSVGANIDAFDANPKGFCRNWPGAASTRTGLQHSDMIIGELFPEGKAADDFIKDFARARFVVNGALKTDKTDEAAKHVIRMIRDFYPDDEKTRTMILTIANQGKVRKSEAVSWLFVSLSNANCTPKAPSEEAISPLRWGASLSSTLRA